MIDELIDSFIVPVSIYRLNQLGRAYSILGQVFGERLSAIRESSSVNESGELSPVTDVPLSQIIKNEKELHDYMLAIFNDVKQLLFVDYSENPPYRISDLYSMFSTVKLIQEFSLFNKIMYVDESYNIFYNPIGLFDFIRNQGDLNIIYFCLIHEMLHILFKHINIMKELYNEYEIEKLMNSDKDFAHAIIKCINVAMDAIVNKYCIDVMKYISSNPPKTLSLNDNFYFNLEACVKFIKSYSITFEDFIDFVNTYITKENFSGNLIDVKQMVSMLVYVLEEKFTNRPEEEDLIIAKDVSEEMTALTKNIDQIFRENDMEVKRLENIRKAVYSLIRYSNQLIMICDRFKIEVDQEYISNLKELNKLLYSEITTEPGYTETQREYMMKLKGVRNYFSFTNTSEFSIYDYIAKKWHDLFYHELQMICHDRDLNVEHVISFYLSLLKGDPPPLKDVDIEKLSNILSKDSINIHEDGVISYNKEKFIADLNKNLSLRNSENFRNNVILFTDLADLVNITGRKHCGKEEFIIAQNKIFNIFNVSPPPSDWIDAYQNDFLDFNKLTEDVDLRLNDEQRELFEKIYKVSESAFKSLTFEDNGIDKQINDLEDILKNKYEEFKKIFVSIKTASSSRKKCFYALKLVFCTSQNYGDDMGKIMLRLGFLGAKLAAWEKVLSSSLYRAPLSINRNNLIEIGELISKLAADSSLEQLFSEITQAVSQPDHATYLQTATRLYRQQPTMEAGR